MRVAPTAPVFVAALLEFLVADILYSARKFAAERQRSKIIPRYIMETIKSDESLDTLLCAVWIPQAGYVPANYRSKTMDDRSTTATESDTNKPAGNRVLLSIIL